MSLIEDFSWKTDIKGWQHSNPHEVGEKVAGKKEGVLLTLKEYKHILSAAEIMNF